MRKLPSYVAAFACAALGVMLIAPANADPLTGIATGTQISLALKGATTETNTLGTGGIGSGMCGNPGLLGNGGVPTGCENTWGVGTITQILDYNTAANYWSNGDGGQYLNYIIYGIADISTSGAIPTLGIDSAGATVGPGADGQIHIDVYLSNSPIDMSAGPSGRTGYGTYPGATSPGSLWLSLILDPGCDLSNPNATLCQTLNAGTAPASGNGSFAASTVTGGSAKGSLSDVSGIFNVQDASAGNRTQFSFSGMCNNANSNPNDCFNEAISDPVSATRIPEPSTLSIMGAALAMIGFASWFRRRKRGVEAEA